MLEKWLFHTGHFRTFQSFIMSLILPFLYEWQRKWKFDDWASISWYLDTTYRFSKSLVWLVVSLSLNRKGNFFHLKCVSPGKCIHMIPARVALWSWTLNFQNYKKCMPTTPIYVPFHYSIINIIRNMDLSILLASNTKHLKVAY